jgi:hypothetical protein
MGDIRILVTASRDVDCKELVRARLQVRLETALSVARRLVVVHGHCGRGGDEYADVWGHEMQRMGFPVTVERHPVKDHPTQDFGPWPAAGPERNNFMVSLGAAECLAFIGPCTSWRCRRPDPHGSHGATGCSDRARQAGIPVEVWPLWKD